MRELILIAGAGGQGIILAGRLLASAAIEPVEHVTFFPAYGAEVRGGTSHCQVIFSSEEIASPVSETWDSVLIMNTMSLDRFLPAVEPGSLLIVNSSLCPLPDSRPAVGVAATGIADDLGDTRVANLVMLGAYLSQKPVVTPDALESQLRQALAGKREALVELNVTALARGLEAGAQE